MQPAKVAKSFGLGEVEVALEPLRGRLLLTALPEALPFALEAIDYLDQPEFKTFWEMDAKRVEDAVRIIGKV